MNEELFLTCKNWFTAYSGSFVYDIPTLSSKLKTGLVGKRNHTFGVLGSMTRLVLDLGLRADDILLAKTIALFHDVGRFPQCRDFGTFSDKDSINHAEYSLKTIREEGILDWFSQEEQQIITLAIQNHNKITIESNLSQRELLFAKLIRDADKLDILRWLISTFDDPVEKKNLFELSVQATTTTLNPEVVAFALQQKPIPYSMVFSLADRVVCWVCYLFDLNFLESKRMLKQAGHIQLLLKELPDEAQEIKSSVLSYLEQL